MANPGKSLLEQIKSTVPVGGGTTCSVRKVLDDLSGEDREGLLAALRDAAIQGTTIAKVLKDRGMVVQPKAIQRHRRSECLCTEVYR